MVLPHCSEVFLFWVLNNVVCRQPCLSRRCSGNINEASLFLPRSTSPQGCPCWQRVPSYSTCPAKSRMGYTPSETHRFWQPHLPRPNGGTKEFWASASAATSTMYGMHGPTSNPRMCPTLLVCLAQQPACLLPCGLAHDPVDPWPLLRTKTVFLRTGQQKN